MSRLSDLYKAMGTLREDGLPVLNLNILSL